MKYPQIGIVTAAPKAEAIMFDMNLDLSIGFTQTDAMGTIDGHEANHVKLIRMILLYFFAVQTSIITSQHETENSSQNNHRSISHVSSDWCD